MSQRRERLAERLPFSDTALDIVESWYHVPLLLALVAFMFWIRARDWRNFLVNGQVYFSGNDAWYHLREVRYTVHHWPGTMGFDPWTGFPVGQSVGQFGTLYDQLVATAAIIAGGGSPSPQTTALTLLFAPAVLGALVAIPVYFLGKRFGGRLGGVVGVAVLAFSKGAFLARTVVGFSDHHAAEAFFQVLAVAVLVVALAVAEREKPIYEQFAERDLAALRRPVGWAALAGITFTLYVWAWPPGVLLIGIVGIFLLVSLPILYLRNESPEHIAIVGAVSLGVAGVLMALTFKTTEISASTFSLLQPALAFAGALGCVFMAWLARVVESRDLPTFAYPGTILGLFVVVVAVMALFLPQLFDFFIDQLTRIVGFGSNANALTVGEAQPPYSTQPGVTRIEAAKQAVEFLYSSYGLALVTGAAGAVLLAIGLALGRLKKKTHAAAGFVLLWTAFMLAATLTQQRFNYYLVAPVATLNAFLVGVVFRSISDSDTRTTVWNFDFYQILTVGVVILFITAPLAVAGSGAGAATAAGRTAETNSHPGSGVLGWNGALTWLNNSTPDEGTYGGGADEMAYYGKYNRTDNFNYPDGSYGVMSWWDYGHWITSIGHRIPVANPFQQHAAKAANFLLARNESVATHRLPNESVANGSEGTRYVMIDWKMVAPGVPGRLTGSKFFAPVVWYNANNTSYQQSDFRAAIYAVRNGQVRPVAYVPNQAYYESMVSRLYNFHGSAIEVKPVVFDYENPQYNANGSLAVATLPTGNETAIRRFQNMSAAKEFVEQDGSARIGGIGPYPEERVPALEHYRLVHATERTIQRQLPGPTSSNWVKTFERVPGAQVTGTAPPNSTVTASVEMKLPTSGGSGVQISSANGSANTFEYHQRAKTGRDGTFTMTLPYSTTGYDKWGPKRGATNVSVRATGPYTFSTSPTVENGSVTFANATVEVPEGAVNGRANRSITVDLERQSVSLSNANATNTAMSRNKSASANTTNASANASTAISANETTVSSTGNDTNTTASNASANHRTLAAISRDGMTPIRASRVGR